MQLHCQWTSLHHWVWHSSYRLRHSASICRLSSPPPRRIFSTRRLSAFKQLHVQTTDRIFTNILPEMYLWTRKSPLGLNFGYHPDLDLDLGIFEGIFAVVVRGKIRHIFANNSKSWRQNFIVFEGGMFHYQQTVQFQCSAGSRSGIFDGIFYHSRTGPISKNVEWSAALVAVCGVRMSLLLFVFLTSIAHT